MSEELDDFGGDDLAAAEPTLAEVIPFPRMRPDPNVAETWDREREAYNARAQRSYRLRNPLDALEDLMRKRSLPTMPWPSQWVELAKRCKLYAGELLGVSGPTGGGKTSFAIQVARACTGAGVPVLWCPLELDEVEVNLRIVANLSAAHMMRVREEWSREQIAHALTAVADRWHYVDKFRQLEQQLEAFRAAVHVCKRVYGKAPLLVVDYIGKIARGNTRDPRQALADAIEDIRAMTSAEECYTILLSQTSRGNNAVLTGKVDLDSAADAIGVSAETGELEHACAVNLALNVFKADDAEVLSSHVLVTKARGTGREGREGFEFRKPGGVWSPLDYLPATPGEVATEIKKTKRKDAPPTEPKDARETLNWKRAAVASSTRKDAVLEALRKAGMVGMGTTELRKVRNAGNPKRLIESLNELERANLIEKTRRGGWRVIPR